MFIFELFKQLKLKSKLLIIFLVLSLGPMITVTGISIYESYIALIESSFDQFASVQSGKKKLIENYVEEQKKDLEVLAGRKNLIQLFYELFGYHNLMKMGYETNFDVDSEEYKNITNNYKSVFQQILDTYGYSDLYLICKAHGHVMFSVKGDSDLGTNLISGKGKNSALASVWRKVIEDEKLSFVDFEPYGDEGHESAFVGMPFYDEAGEAIAVIVLKMTAETIEKMIHSREGMGKTGESYLIGYHSTGEKRGVYEFRSTMKTMGDGKYTVGYALEPLKYWEEAILGQKNDGQGIYIDSSGDDVIVTYSKIDFMGAEWALISKKSKSEVIKPIMDMILYIMIAGAFISILILLFAIRFSLSLTKPIVSCADFAKEISKGNYDVGITNKYQDEIGDLIVSLGDMAVHLKDANWLSSGRSELEDELRGISDVQLMSKRLITFLVKHFDQLMGAFYIKEDSTDQLNLLSSYAFSDRSGNFNTIAMGEGLVGQAALEQEVLYYKGVTDSSPLYNYGAGERIPSFFVAVPLVFEDKLLGVLLMGSDRFHSDTERVFIKRNIENIATLFNSAKTRTVILDLLEQSKQQQEELKATNDELGEQAKALKDSEAELQAQQEELRVTNEELEERTKALEDQTAAVENKNIELEKAKENIEKKAKDIESASTYKSEFMANMSHELRTPLNSILILSQLLSQNKEDNLTDKQQEFASTIHDSGKNLLNLINDILDLSKVESGKMEMNVGSVYFTEVRDSLLGLFNPVANEKGINFSIQIDERLPEVFESDEQRVQQIIKNLISNAMKFTNKGGEVELTIKPSEEEKMLLFHVKDSGIGISKEKIHTVFEAFKQADGTTSRKYGGTGLGLSISREFAKLLGGGLELESEEGKGSQFTLKLPFSVEAKVITTAKMLDTPKESKVVSEEKTETPELNEKMFDVEYIADDRRHINHDEKIILIVEDDPIFAKILFDLAKGKEYQCLVAQDGETGLHFADYYKPSAIILDIKLPGIDGWEVMERLKANSATRHIPVHIMSGSDKAKEALEKGAIGFLTKPIDEDSLNGAFVKFEKLIDRSIRKLLVIEDNDAQRDSIVALLEDDDVETSAVNSAEKAFEVLDKEIFDCIILDLGLEGTSGHEFLNKFRGKDHLNSTPVIIYTGRDISQEEELELKKNAQSIIIKSASSPERLIDETSLFLHRVEADMPEDKKQMIRMIHDKEETLNGKKVLLVDDDIRNVFALSSVLEDNGLEVSIARNGKECLGKLEKEPEVDLVLMDIMMPEMDGYEATAEIRKQHQYRNLPIIALTAKAMKGDRQKCIDAGASDYLSKPIDTDKLLSLLRVWLYS